MTLLCACQDDYPTIHQATSLLKRSQRTKSARSDWRRRRRGRIVPCLRCENYGFLTKYVVQQPGTLLTHSTLFRSSFSRNARRDGEEEEEEEEALKDEWRLEDSRLPSAAIQSFVRHRYLFQSHHQPTWIVPLLLLQLHWRHPSALLHLQLHLLLSYLETYTKAKRIPCDDIEWLISRSGNQFYASWNSRSRRCA